MENYKEVIAITLAVATGFFYLLWFFVPPIRLVWQCLSMEENLPVMNTLKACYDSAWPFKPAMFRRQMRLWLELRLLHPRPRKEPSWHLDPKTKRYQLQFDDAAFEHHLEELLVNDEFQLVRERLVTDDRSFEELLSGCHLSRMVSDMFEAIEKEGGVAKKSVTTQVPV